MCCRRGTAVATDEGSCRRPGDAVGGQRRRSHQCERAWRPRGPSRPSTAPATTPAQAASSARERVRRAADPSSGACASDAQSVSTLRAEPGRRGGEGRGRRDAGVGGRARARRRQGELSPSRSRRRRVYGQSSTYTSCPPSGRSSGAARRLYAISGQPVVLLYGVGRAVARVRRRGCRRARRRRAEREPARARLRQRARRRRVHRRDGSRDRAFQSAHGLRRDRRAAARLGRVRAGRRCG